MPLALNRREQLERYRRGVARLVRPGRSPRDRTAAALIERAVATLPDDSRQRRQILWAALHLVELARDDLDTIEAMAISEARIAEMSWQDISQALGLRSRQAAEQRYLRLMPPLLRDDRSASRDPARARGTGRRRAQLNQLLDDNRAVIDNLAKLLDSERERRSSEWVNLSMLGLLLGVLHSTNSATTTLVNRYQLLKQIADVIRGEGRWGWLNAELMRALAEFFDLEKAVNEIVYGAADAGGGDLMHTDLLA